MAAQLCEYTNTLKCYTFKTVKFFVFELYLKLLLNKK